jgi:hypothetical protein
MRKPNRALSVEAVEDRSLPSTSFVFVEPTFSYRSYQPAHRGGFAEPVGYSARSFQAESFIRIRFSDNSVLFLRETPTGFQLIPVFTGNVPRNQPPQPTVPTPFQGPVADARTSSAGGSARNTDGGNTPVAQSRGPLAPAGARANVGDVAIVPTAQSNPVAVRAEADQAAATAAAQASVSTGQPAVAPSAPLLTGHGNSIAYAFTAVNPEAGAEAVPPAEPAPTPRPAPTPDAGAVESGIVQLAVAAAGPVAGLVPFDLATLSAGAGEFLGRVADLAPSWPDSMPAFTDTLWVATAAVLGGGAIYASRGRSVPRPGRDPLASALSEWERRNGRATG